MISKRIYMPLVSFLLICLMCACGDGSHVIHVAPTGNNQSDGSEESPYKSVARALVAAQEMLVEKDVKETIIQLHAGLHHIQTPIKISSDQFNLARKHLIIRGDVDRQTTISGGLILDQWKKSKDGLYWADIPRNLNDVRELFVDGQRATRARHPNDTYLRTAQVGADKRTHFFFNKGDFPLPEKVSQTELVLLHDWSISRIPVSQIELDAYKLTTVDSIGAKALDFFTLDHWEENPRYFLENDRTFIDLDFEWIYDRSLHKIAIKIPEHLSSDDLEITIPQSEGLVVLEGSMDQLIKNVSFENIHFQHSAWPLPELGYGGIQATHFDPRPNLGKGWSVVPAALYAKFADSCGFERCTFEHLGGSGLWIGEGCSNQVIKACAFSDVSGNGIMIGEGRDRTVEGQPWWKHTPNQAARNNLIEDCTITQCGQQFFGAVGIWCGLTRETQIIGNKIFDLPYTGVSIGWMWNPSPTPARQNTVEGNHIHHIMNKLSDGGGIYMLGLQPGSKLLNNLIHDVTINVGRAESNGMFLDEGITDVLVAENIIYNIAKSPIRFHKATTNTVQDNILFCGADTPPFRYNRTDSSLIKKVNNLIYHPNDASYSSSLEAAIASFQEK